MTPRGIGFHITRLGFVSIVCVGIAAGVAACQVFDGETTDTSEYECPSLMPIMTPDGSCTASLDDAIAMVESMDDPELLISPGDYTISRAIEHPITFRSSRARSFSRPAAADFERIDCAAIPGIVGAGLEAKAVGLEHEPKLILRAANTETGIVINMGAGEHRMALIGAELYGQAGGPALTVRKGKLGIVQSRVSSPIVVTGGRSRVFFSGARIAGDPVFIFDGETIDSNDNWSLYDVVGSCDEALLVVEDGAVVNSIGLELAGHSPLGLCVDAAEATLCGGSIHDITSDDESRLGRGAHVVDGGKLTLRSVDLYTVREAGVWAKGSGTELTIEQETAISDVNNSFFGNLQMSPAIILEDGAALTAEGLSISDIEGPGIWLTGGSSATADDVTITSSTGAGVAVFDATLALSSGAISGIGPDVDAGGGFGISVDSLALGPASVRVSDTAIDDNTSSGIFIQGDGGSVEVTGGSISGTDASDGRLFDGFGIAAIDVCSGLAFSSISFDDNDNAHIILHSSNATLASIAFQSTGCRYADFVQQGCTAACVTPLTAGELGAAGISDPPNTTEICPNYDYAVYHDDLKLYMGVEELQ